MGSVIRRELVAIRCELRSCHAIEVVQPTPVALANERRDVQLSPLVAAGWGLVLTPQLRSYCPVHRERVWSCTCRTNPDRSHLCTVHNDEAAELVWGESLVWGQQAEAA